MYMPRQLVFLGQALLELVGQGAHLMRVCDKLTAALGQRDRVIYPLKEQTAKLVLKLLYLK